MTKMARRAEVERLTRERDALRDQLKHYAHGESGVSRLIEERAENSRLTYEVERLTRERDEWKRTAEHLRGMAPYIDASAEVERLRALLRDECMGHADGCGCRACKEVFRAALGEGE